MGNYLGQFVMEYVGELVTATQFKQRAIHYDRDGVVHHYFMQLERDMLIDATARGWCNIVVCIYMQVTLHDSLTTAACQTVKRRSGRSMEWKE